LRAPTPRSAGAALALAGTLTGAVAVQAHLGSAWTSAGVADFRLERSSVAPKRAFFDTSEGVRVRFRFTSDGPIDLTIRFVRRGRILRRYALGALEPGVEHVQGWNGLTRAGKLAPEGGYKVMLVPAGRPSLELGRFRFRHHLFPVRGPHGTRGPNGEFGASRSGGRVHEGFDVLAACGTRLVVARGGVVARRGHDPVLYGNFVLIRGRKTRRSFFYSHLSRRAAVRRGERVRTGQRLGRVGRTGNARTTPCHLHFEIRRRGRAIDPEPSLRHWDRYS
jgi:murein DD-endopeptidase MepM/ murein hydrolase activator NlpD